MTACAAPSAVTAALGRCPSRRSGRRCLSAFRVERSPFSGADVEDVILGNTNQAGEDSRNVARHAGLLAGLPVEAAGQTVNRLCASGLAAVLDAARACAAAALLFVASMSSMSRAPFVLAKAERL